MDRGLIKYKRRDSSPERAKEEDLEFLQAFNQASLSNESLALRQRQEPWPKTDEPSANDATVPSQGPVALGQAYGSKAGHLIRTAGANVLSEVAQGNGLLGALTTAVETAATSNERNQEELGEEMLKLDSARGQAKELLGTTLAERDKQESIVSSYKIFSFGPFSWKYILLVGLGVTAGFSLALVFGKFFNYRWEGPSLSSSVTANPVVVNHFKETITETTRSFSLKDGFTTTIVQKESFRQQWGPPFPSAKN